MLLTPHQLLPYYMVNHLTVAESLRIRTYIKNDWPYPVINILLLTDYCASKVVLLVPLRMSSLISSVFFKLFRSLDWIAVVMVLGESPIE